MLQTNWGIFKTYSAIFSIVNPNKAEIFFGSFFLGERGVVSLIYAPRFIFQEELI